MVNYGTLSELSPLRRRHELFPVYVEYILAATNNEHCKVVLFEELNNAYGIKDKWLLKQYLGVEVKQTKEHITTRQSKYARDTLHMFGFKNAHAFGNSMEVNAQFTMAGESEHLNSKFPVRVAIEMLMCIAMSTRLDLSFSLGKFS